MMRKNPERIAWIVLFGAFGVFLTLLTTVPVTARSYLLYSQTPQQATLEVVGGTASVTEAGAAAPIAVSKSQQLSEGSTVEVDENSRGIVTLFDGSTVTLFPGTQITLRNMRTAAFSWGVQPIYLAIDEARGQVRVAPAPLYESTPQSKTGRVFEITTRDMLASLTEGSYAVEALGDSSQISVRDGTATVTAKGSSVTVGRGQRTVVWKGDAPLAAMPAPVDLMVNGDFKDPLPRGWTVLDNQNPPGIVPGSAEIVALGDIHAMHIQRSGSIQTSAIVGMISQINREVSDYQTVRLAADIRLHFQSLSGGGYLSSEYPVILRLRYRDAAGNDAEWVHGFYYQNDAKNPTNNGEMIPQDVWYPFETENLKDVLDPPPFYITSLQIYASGWDYDSYVTSVRLIVE